MTDLTKAEQYLIYLDRILAGEKDIGPVADVEVAALLRLAQNMIAVDISVNSEIRENLRKELLERISQADHYIQELEDELTEEELQYAAAGLQGLATENICPRCGARRTMSLGSCPHCGYQH